MSECVQGGQKRVLDPWSGVTDCCKPPEVGAGTRVQVELLFNF